MPLAAAHIVFSILLASAIFYLLKIKMDSRMALFAGISGLIPDIDIAVFFVLNYFLPIPITSVHRTITHSLVLPVAGALIAAMLLFAGKKKFAQLGILFSIGASSHIILDGAINGTVMPFYPLSTFAIGLDMVSLLIPAGTSQFAYRTTLMAALDGIVLLGWLLWLEYKKKARNYI